TVPESFSRGNRACLRHDLHVAVLYFPLRLAAIPAAPLREVSAVKQDNGIRRRVRVGFPGGDDGRLFLWRGEGTRLLLVLCQNSDPGSRDNGEKEDSDECLATWQCG